MSKHETWRTRTYWDKVGGLLIEEFIAVRGNKSQGRRIIDGLIILNEKKGTHHGNSFNIEGKEVIVIQAKAQRIGMPLLGQAYFSKLIVERHNPKSVRSVAICGRDDEIMQELSKTHGIEIVVIPDRDKNIFQER